MFSRWVQLYVRGAIVWLKPHQSQMILVNVYKMSLPPLYKVDHITTHQKALCPF